MTVARTPGQRRLGTTARSRARKLRETRDRIAREQAKLDHLEWDAARHRADLSRRLGIELPLDPTGRLYDCLDLVERMPDGGWRWLGTTNNKDLPVVRWGRSERSVTRYLAEQFGLIPEDWQGLLFPRVTGPRDYHDVNPWRRHRRAYGEGAQPLGNPGRFGTLTGVPPAAGT